MNIEIDDLLRSGSPCDPLEPISTTTINDPTFIKICDFLRAPVETIFDTTHLFRFHGGSSTNPAAVLSNSSVDQYQQPGTVNPIYIPSIASNESRISTIQSVSSEPGKIEIAAHPRSKFRPRTEKESKDSSHYIRCEDDIQPEHPTILIPKEWSKQNNLIEVTLVDKDKQPHPYTIENKERKTSPLVFKQDEANSLYFHVTERDLKKGHKTFLIEYIKPKQDGEITKELIKNRQLDQSMLRFTRFHQISDGTYQRDESSIAYSCLMTEDYGSYNIEDVFPLYGPMCGNQKVSIDLKGHLPKDFTSNLTISLTENQTSWSYQITTFQKNRNTFTFLMPPFPYTIMGRVKANMIIQYKQKIIHQCCYKYSIRIDEELNEDNLNQLSVIAPLPNTSNELSGALLDCSSMDMGGGIRGAKRARQ